jgi:hypothetical protein
MLPDAQRAVAGAVLAAGGHVGVARERCVRVLRRDTCCRADRDLRLVPAALRNYDRC